MRRSKWGSAIVGFLVAGLLLVFAVAKVEALSLLGTYDFSPAYSNEMDVNPNGDLVYLSGGMGQTPGVLRVDVTNPAAIISSVIASGYGGGVAVNPLTGRIATTRGYTPTLGIFSGTGTLFDTEGLSGCGGSLAAGSGNRFGVSTQCSDSFAIYDEGTMNIVISTGAGGVGSSVVFNPATGNYYHNRTPAWGLGGSRPRVYSPSGSTYTWGDLGGVPNGAIQEANGVANRLYYNTDAGNLLVLDGSTHAVLATLNGIYGDVAGGTLFDRFYVNDDGVIKVFDAVTNTQILGETLTLPDGYSPHSLDMGAGDDRLYVLGSKSGVGNHRLFVLQEQAAVPEPSTLLLLGSGLAGFVAWRMRRSA